MKKFIIASCVALLLSACANTPTQYYRLPDSVLKTNTELQKPAIDTKVTLASYLNSSSMVYEVAPQQVQFTQNNIWAEDLQSALQNNLLNKLNQQSRHQRYVLPNGATEKLNINIQSFYGSYTGDVVVEGYAQWLKGNQIVRSRNFSVRTEQQGSGYPAMLEAMNNALNQVAIDLQ